VYYILEFMRFCETLWFHKV